MTRHIGNIQRLPRVVRLSLGLLLLVSAGLAFSQLHYQETFGDYTVYYNLVNSTFLTEAVAERYDIDRGENNSLLTISVRASNEEGTVEDQPSSITGSVEDLIRVYSLNFREYKDPNAVYYLAEVPTQSRTELDFDITISPEDSEKSFNLEFSQFIPKADK